ncbi:hypothetical protein SAMN02910298_00027 [Pseudobutyrivibrio sp. YE44]|uniref:hypothetical protein n=1 Tax=Pseudobutyrivibrio sp. YE44 TaxID=1520802 RepID=UPI0008863960|nr:hypothetical protein [Pseudobutyrivibrio sp. YE44]SDB04272.1 hypothetical protein SAMN02910298_00027 [Pseudobutyrivibrio sp. YE44]
MDWVTVNIIVLLISLNLLIAMPIYFKRKNARTAAREAFQEKWDNMVELDKHYAAHINELNKHLNTINYWLKTGKDPNASEEESEKQEKEDRFFAGLMSPLEAKKWKAAVEKAKKENELEDIDVKSLRVNDFCCVDMEPMEVEQSKMEFVYGSDFGDYIYYCATPDTLENQLYRHVIYFTTARPTAIPLVYPYKYEGAQMLSLYKHPGQTVWFLKNWKHIRQGLEGNLQPEWFELDEDVADFDL